MKRLLEFASRKRHWLLWAGALGFGLVGVAGTHGFITEQLDAERQRLQGENVLVRILVAGTDLQAGATLDADSLAVRELPSRYVPASAMTEADFEQVQGQMLRVAMHSGEPVLGTALDTPEPGFSDRVRSGIRAMTISVDEVNSVSGMLRPGDRIDLLFSTQSPGAIGAGGEITTPIMQELMVLATGQDATDTNYRGNAAHPFSTITVEVTPEQAQKLVLAQRSGRLTALLRNPGDRLPMTAGTLDIFSLLGIKRPAVGLDTKPIEVIVGGQGLIDQSRVPGTGGAALSWGDALSARSAGGAK